MKIAIPKSKNLALVCHKNKSLQFITDDTRELDSHSLLIRTKSNAKFIDDFLAKDFAKNTNSKIQTQDFLPSIISPKEFASIFAPLPSIIGITGTNGKTTTAAIIYSILLDLGFSCALFGTRGAYKNDIKIRPKGLTTPTLLEIYALLDECRDCDFVVMEVSSHAIVQERIAGLDFVSKVLTNITSDHLDYHKTLEEYIRVKNHFLLDEKNLASGGSVIINADEKNASFNKNALYYGIEKAKIGTKQVNLKANAYSLDNGISAHISFVNELETQQAIMEANLYGKHNLYNALAAILCVKSLQNLQNKKSPNPLKSLDCIVDTVQHFGGVEGRMEVVSQNPLIIVDFAHTHDGMEQIFASFKGREIVAVFGAGGDRDKTKRPKMGLCAYKYAKKLYITSDNPRSENPQDIINDIISGIPKNALDLAFACKKSEAVQQREIICEIDRKVAITKAIQNLAPNEILLILGKGDETYQILGDKSIHFDDREVVKEVLASLGQKS